MFRKGFVELLILEELASVRKVELPNKRFRINNGHGSSR